MIDRKFSKKSTSKNSIKLEHLSSKKIINKDETIIPNIIGTYNRLK